MKRGFRLIVLVAMLCACGAGGGTDSQTGTIQISTQWPEVRTMHQKEAAPPGVVTVHMIITGPGMNPMQKDFVASSNTGTITKVPAGSDRVVTLQALNENSRLTHEGSASGVTVVDRQTSHVGPIVMAVAAEGLWNDSRWGQAFWAQ